MDIGKYEKVKIISGRGALLTHAEELCSLGTHALIVSGRSGADKCGAIRDITGVLDKHNVKWTRFNTIPENPPAEMCREGGETARKEGCDFIIAVGGGSSLDAGKAIAAYAANPQCGVNDIFDDSVRVNDCLPIAAVPTTAGTGSEACRYSVLTIDGGIRKKTFKHSSAYPAVSFVCPEYTETMSAKFTLSTALDALAHSIESYLSPKSDEASEKAALYAASEIWDVIFRGNGFDSGACTPAARDRLAYAACAAGMAIDVTGTGFPHPLGYSITLTRGIPHGSACAVFEGEYLRYNMLTEIGRKKIDVLAAHLSATADEMIEKIPQMSGVGLKLGKEEREELIDRVAGAGNYANSPYVITRKEMSDIYTRLFD